jgi:hypothetical protein
MAHLALPDRADAADAKGLQLRELARIKDESLVAYARVELLEFVVGIRRRVKGHDDRRLEASVEIGVEAELGHAGRQRLAIARIACEPRRLAAFSLELRESLMLNLGEGRFTTQPSFELFRSVRSSRKSLRVF